MLINSWRNIALLVYAMLITLLSLLPGGSDLQFNVWDKLQHCGAYFLLMLLSGGNNYSQLLTRGIIVIGFSALLEFIQGFSPGRVPSIADMLANSLGVLLAIGFLSALRFWKKT